MAIVGAPLRPESAKFPVSSLLAGNLALPETGWLVTASSSGESRANCAAVPALIVIPDIHEFSAAKSVRSRPIVFDNSLVEKRS